MSAKNVLIIDDTGKKKREKEKEKKREGKD